MPAPVTRGLITLEGDGTQPVVSRTFMLRWDTDKPSPGIRLEEHEAAQAAAFVESLPTGKIDPAMMQAAAPLLSSLLGAERFAAASYRTEQVELISEAPIPALTDVPWEAAARCKPPLATKQEALFDQLLASVPLCRLVSGAPSVLESDGFRPRLLLLISNPAGIDGGRLQVRQILIACQQVLKEYPVFHVRVVGPTATWATVAPMIVEFEPTVLVVAAHGSSDPQNGGPTLAFVREHDQFAVDRIPVAELADCLARTRSCRIVALIACDLVRSSDKSGAVELVQRGVPEVVAMQGSIDQLVARRFLARLLGEILAGQSVPQAACAARRIVRDHAHAIFPAVFRAAGLAASPGALADLSMLYARAIARLDARVRESGIMSRAELEMSLRAVLASAGVAFVRGGFGDGTSTLLRKGISDFLRERSQRPVLYLDHDQRLDDESPTQWLARELAEVTRAHPILRPKSAPDFIGNTPTAEEMGTWTFESEISLILDNLPERPTDSETRLVEALIASYATGRYGVLILASRGPLTSEHLPPTLHVPAFSRPEVAAYAKQFLPGVNADELYERTGGTPLLLDLERRMTRDANVRTEPRNEEALLAYLRRVQGCLSARARTAAVRLAQFNGALDQALIREFVTPDLGGAALQELSEAGLPLVFERGSRTWMLVPPRKRAGFLSHDPAGVQEALAHLFAARYDAAPNDVVPQVAAFGGAGPYLRLLQDALTLIGREDVSVDIALQAQGKGLSAGDLLTLFETAIRLLGSERTDVPEILVAAARAALAVGRTQQAEAWLQDLPEALSAQHECEALLLRLILAKDRQQGAGLEEILSYRTRILELVAEPRDDTDQEWQRVRREALFDILPALLFLIGESAEAMAQSLQAVLPKFSPTERAQLLATFAEREMREPPERQDSNRIAEWVTDAAALLNDQSDARSRTYVLYQYAQYLAKRPEPRRREAWELYELARAAGELAGEARRHGLALLRLAELECAHAELRGDGDWKVRRLRELDGVVACLSDATTDALSMRTLGRLQQWAAEHEPNVEQRRSRYMQAAHALRASQLSSPSDKRRFAEICIRALDSELGPGGRFLAAQRFVASMRFDIARQLNIAVPVDNPGAARDAIRATIG